MPDPNSPYTSAGHNQIFTGPDGRLWTSFHAYTKGTAEAAMVMDPIWFENGRVKTEAPTFNLKSVETLVH